MSEAAAPTLTQLAADFDRTAGIHRRACHWAQITDYATDAVEIAADAGRAVHHLATQIVEHPPVEDESGQVIKARAMAWLIERVVSPPPTPRLPLGLIEKSRAVVNAVTFDEAGAMVAGHWQGGNGGLLSRETIKAVDVLRTELEIQEAAQ